MKHATVKAMHFGNVRSANRWANMLYAPQDVLTRAPSNTPYLASKTRFVRSIDIPYASTFNGKFSVAATPDPFAALAVTAQPATFPAVAGAITCTNILTKIRSDEQGYLSSGLLSAENTSGVNLGTFSAVPTSTYVANANGKCWPMSTSSGGHYQVSISAANHAAKRTYILWEVIAGGALLAESDIYYMGLGEARFTSVALGVNMQALRFKIVNADGSLNTNAQTASYSLTITTSAGQITPVGSQGKYALVSHELATVGAVGLVRCTAISMLCTSMASVLKEGGELVIARTRSEILSEDDHMEAIKRLPEENYWQSGNLKKGAYAWWMPDDLESYEPKPVNSDLSNVNILIASGKMAEEGGILRVVVTWNFEFYTPSQLFARDYNTCYAQVHRDYWQALAQKPAVSANAGHLALIASLGSLAMEIYNFYTSNKTIIDPLAAKTAQAARALVARPPAKKNVPQKPKREGTVQKRAAPKKTA